MRKAHRILTSLMALALAFGALALPARAEIHYMHCGANGCPSMTFEERCQGEYWLSEEQTHETGSSELCHWRYRMAWMMLVCTECGNTFQHQKIHVEGEVHSASCGKETVYCLLPHRN